MTADELPAASSFISSRWTRDNLVTGHPARLYSGRIIERIEAESLEALIEELQETRGPSGRAAGGWECSPGTSPAPVPTGRSSCRSRWSWTSAGRGIARNATSAAQRREHAALHRAGLTRFVRRAPGARDPGRGCSGGALHRPARTSSAHLRPRRAPRRARRGGTFVADFAGRARDRRAAGRDDRRPRLPLRRRRRRRHRDRRRLVNDGDFVARRRPDGAFDVRLTAARRREGGSAPACFSCCSSR